MEINPTLSRKVIKKTNNQKVCEFIMEVYIVRFGCNYPYSELSINKISC